MKFDFSYLIEGVSAHYFILGNGDILYLSLNKEVVLYNCSIIWANKYDRYIYPKLIFDNQVLVQNRNIEKQIEEVFLLSLANGESNAGLLYENFNIISDLVYSSSVIIYQRFNGLKTLSLFDLRANSIIWNYQDVFHLLFISEIGILGRDDTNTCIFLNRTDGSKLWTFDLNEIGTWTDYDKSEKQTEVSKVVGENNGNLYVYLNSGKILVLNTETGKQVALISNNKNDDQGSFSRMFFNAIEIDRENDKLIQLFNQRYTEVDLTTCQVTQTNIDDMKELNLMNMDNFIFDPNYIYFSDRNQCKIASFNRETMKIEWVRAFVNPNTKEVDEGRYGRELKLSGNRLYVLDNKHTLHIYESQVL